MNSVVIQELQTIKKKAPDPVGYVFLSSKGKAYNPDHFSERYMKTLTHLAGVRPLHFHCLRHTYASHFIMSGVGDIVTLQKTLGHADLKMTLRYSHLSEEHRKRAAEIVSFKAPEKVQSPFLDLLPGGLEESSMKVGT